MDNSQMMGKYVKICWRWAFKFWNVIPFSPSSVTDSVFGYTPYSEDLLTLSQSPSESIPTFDKDLQVMSCFPQKGFKGL